MPRDVDILIIGAGPAGMTAAIRAQALGLTTVILDEHGAPGGQVWRAVERRSGAGQAEALGSDYARGNEVANRFRTCGAEYRPETQVWQIEPGFRIFTLCKGEVDVISAKTVVIATGAMERARPFPGWTLPGVMTVGAAQILLKSADQIPDSPVWIAGCGPLVLLYANQLIAAGGRIAGILDTAPSGSLGRALPHLPRALGSLSDLAKGLRWLKALRHAGIPVSRGVTGFAAEGSNRLEAVSYRTAAGRSQTVAADVLLVHEGVIPRIHVTLALGCKHAWNALGQYFAPVSDEWGETSLPGLFVAGDTGGVAGAKAATLSGEIAAYGTARYLERLDDAGARAGAASARRALRRALALRPFLDALYPAPPMTAIGDETVVCRCEEVTAGSIRAAVRTGATGPNQAKAYTRCGMGPCQGRQCGYPTAGLIADMLGSTVADIGLARVRPPLRPVTLGQLASLDEKRPAA
ncbi:FAD-dependent oxidoreductase [Chelatococcus sp. GCM10030263]|uniref:FAD-dependent oxidoreductase n=1 Tax=Chelatococcus sp. GCM10030263 TaxID=3273387 RepID=UPI003618431E